RTRGRVAGLLPSDLRRAQALVEARAVEAVVVASIRPLMRRAERRHLMRQLGHDAPGSRSGKGAAGLGRSMGAMMPSQPVTILELPISAQEVAVIAYTSGQSAAPKGVRPTHTNLLPTT